MKQISTIKAGSEELPFSFGMAALADFLESEDLKLADLGNIADRFQLSTVINLVYIGLKHGHRKAGAPFNFTADDVADLMDENPALMSEAMDLFAKSMPNADAGNVAKPAQKVPAKSPKI